MRVRWEQRGGVWYGVVEGEDRHFAIVWFNTRSGEWRYQRSRDLIGGTAVDFAAARTRAEKSEGFHRRYTRIHELERGAHGSSG